LSNYNSACVQQQEFDQIPNKQQIRYINKGRPAQRSTYILINRMEMNDEDCKILKEKIISCLSTVNDHCIIFATGTRTSREHTVGLDETMLNDFGCLDRIEFCQCSNSNCEDCFLELFYYNMCQL
jgi:hypothetical protein